MEPGCLESGDSIALCSDGLHRYVNAGELASIVDSSESPEEACAALIAKANERGGEDNITVIVSQPETGDTLRSTWIDSFDTVVP